MSLIETPPPTAEEMALAAQASRALAGGRIEYSQLPGSVVRVLEAALAEIADGRAVSLEADKSEMTTFEAARYLNVSRPYVIKLLDQHKMQYRLVGTHRRIPTEQVMACRRMLDERSHAATAELQAMAQAEQSGQ